MGDWSYSVIWNQSFSDISPLALIHPFFLDLPVLSYKLMRNVIHDIKCHIEMKLKTLPSPSFLLSSPTFLLLLNAQKNVADKMMHDVLRG